MPPQTTIKSSFASGELAPALFARVDLEKYHTGAALMRNFFVDYRGGASNRAGTEYVGRCRYLPTYTARLIPFQFSQDQTYVLEFGQNYIRFITDGGYVLEPAIAVTALSDGTPLQFVTATPHGYSPGDWIFVSDATGETQVDDETYVVGAVTGPNGFTVTDLNGAPINASAFGVYAGNGLVQRVYTLVTPYQASDLALLKYAQSADTMTLTHPGYPQADLVRTGQSAWTLTPCSFGFSIGSPLNVVVSPSGDATNDPRTTLYAYCVTAINGADGTEGTNYGQGVAANIDIDEIAGWNLVQWDGVVGATSYNIYRAPAAGGAPVPEGCLFGYVGSVYGVQVGVCGWLDSNFDPDFTKTPPVYANPFAGAGLYPGSVCYYQQRRVFAGSADLPSTLNMSKTGSYSDFSTRYPVSDDDAISATLVSLQVNTIQHLVPMPTGLVVLTSGGAWLVSGGGNGTAVTPASITAVPQAFNGCSDVPPITINYDVLYIQAKSSVVRDLAYNFYVNTYVGSDITVLSSHLFYGYQILEWAYAEEPYKVVWAVRDDGTLLSLTYLKDQDVIGWAHHDTNGLFQSVCTVSEGDENVAYFIVQRYLGGQWVNCVERMASRYMPDGPEDAWFLDCARQYELNYPQASLNIAAATGTGVVFTASAAVFSPSMVGWVIRAGGGVATITAITDSMHAVATISRPVAAVVPNSNPTMPVPQAAGDWSCTQPVTTVSGLDHLDGMTVTALADGGVVTGLTVVNGSITLPSPATVITVGLPYQCQLQTMNLEVPGAPTLQGRRKRIVSATAKVENTRGLQLGSTFDALQPIKTQGPQVLPNLPAPLVTGDQYINFNPNWDTAGQVCVQQDFPLPATVLGVVTTFEMGDT